MTRRILGIDLGTTNTCIASMDGDRPTVIPNSEGSRTTPSVVAFAQTGDVLIGQPARRQAVTNPTRTIHSVKRLMGQRPDQSEVEEFRKRATFPIKADDAGKLVIGGGVRDRSPIEISAMILKEVRSAAEEYFGEEVTDAVLTVPAYFDDAQRGATQDAARVAGLNVLRLINEPTAAALSYGWERGKTGVLVVYDWGGGTFDCTVLDVADGVIQVRSTRGEPYLGGDDIDHRLVGLLSDAFYREHGVEVGGDPVALQRLREAAENAKMELSSASDTEVILPFLAADETGPKHLQMSVTRARFDGLIADLVEQTLSCCRQALDDAGVTPREVDEVLLIGGSTKIPLVERRLEEFFGEPPRKGVNRDEAVALGAALQGAIISGEVDDILLVDVLPLSLGIGEGERFACILRRNVTIPTYRTESFSTTRDHQSSVLLKVYQGDHTYVRDNKLLATLRLDRLPPARAGQIKIDVKFEVDQNGILNVSATDKTTGASRHMVVRDSLRLTESEIASFGVALEED